MTVSWKTCFSNMPVQVDFPDPTAAKLDELIVGIHLTVETCWNLIRHVWHTHRIRCTARSSQTVLCYCHLAIKGSWNTVSGDASHLPHEASVLGGFWKITWAFKVSWRIVCAGAWFAIIFNWFFYFTVASRLQNLQLGCTSVLKT